MDGVPLNLGLMNLQAKRNFSFQSTPKRIFSRWGEEGKEQNLLQSWGWINPNVLTPRLAQAPSC